MNIKLIISLFAILVNCAVVIEAHGHAHDDDHHHHHEEVNPSFKYSKQANEQVKREVPHANHDHHGHSHGGEPCNHDHSEPHHSDKLKAQKPAG